jgi:parallel beta-helix repeat protein
MSRSNFIAAVPLFLCLVLSTQISYASNKSVYIISSQDDSEIQAYGIDSNHISWQATANVYVDGTTPGNDYSPVAVAVWPQKSLLFFTNDGVPEITFASSKTLIKIGEFDTGTSVNGSIKPGLGGIVVDTVQQKIYAAERTTNILHIYSWNDTTKTLVPDSNHILQNITTGQYNGIFGIALDANGLLYVSDGTKTIHYYNTTTWALAGSFDILVNAIPPERPAIAIAIDPNRGYLYTGDFVEEGEGGDAHLVRTRLSSDHNSIEISVGDSNMVIGIDADKDTGLVYCTTTNRDLRVYNSNLVLQDIKTGLGRYIPGWPNGVWTGPAGVAVGGCFVPPVVHNTTKDTNDPNITLAILHANTTGDTLVAYPGTYKENVNINKQLTLQSTNPEDPFTVAQTVISCINDYTYQYNTVTFTNNSVINGFTIANSNNRGVSCSGSSSPTIKNCYIRNNGTGVYCNLSAPSITDCVIRNNSSVGLYCDSLSAPTIAGCIVKNNSYGIKCSGAGQVKIIDNWIVNNGSYGVYLYSTAAEVTVRNNTISKNASGGIYRYGGNDPNISNSIFWNNGTSPNYNNFSGTPACTNVNYSCINSSSTGSYSGRDNITTDPCFVAVDANDYHLKAASLCRNAGDPNRTYDSNETDIDSQPRRNGIGRVDIGGDEYYATTDLNADLTTNFLDYAIFANAWKTSQGVAKWNAACDFIDNNNIDINDLAWFAQYWYFPPADQQSLIKDMSEEEPPPPLPPSIYLAYDGSMTPDPNTEVTVYVYSDIPLFSMDMVVTVTGDANITTAMGSYDCTEYGWDSEWGWDPYIDNGWVQFGGTSWEGVATGTVGYFKFIYNSGQVTVSIAADSYAYDTNSQPAAFSTGSLIFGGESMQSSQQQSMMQSSSEESAAMDSTEVVDVNELADWLEQLWLEDAEIRAANTPEEWQQFIDNFRSGQFQ